jgi:hypothetical protein
MTAPPPKFKYMYYVSSIVMDWKSNNMVLIQTLVTFLLELQD